MMSYRTQDGHCMFFFFNNPATPEFSTLSHHDALPISSTRRATWSATWTMRPAEPPTKRPSSRVRRRAMADRKSTRLNSSHANISYAVFCLKKKNKTTHITQSVNQTLVKQMIIDNAYRV